MNNLDLQQLMPPSKKAADLASEVFVFVLENKLDELSDLLKRLIAEDFTLVGAILEYMSVSSLMFYSHSMHVDIGLQYGSDTYIGNVPLDELSDAKREAIDVLNGYCERVSKMDIVGARSLFGELLFRYLDSGGGQQDAAFATINIVFRDVTRAMYSVIGSATACCSPNALARLASYHRYLAFITRHALRAGNWCEGCKPGVDLILAFERADTENHDAPRIDYVAAPGNTEFRSGDE